MGSARRNKEEKGFRGSVTRNKEEKGFRGSARRNKEEKGFTRAGLERQLVVSLQMFHFWQQQQNSARPTPLRELYSKLGYSHTKTMLPTKKSVPRSCRQSDHRKIS